MTLDGPWVGLYYEVGRVARNGLGRRHARLHLLGVLRD